MRKKIVSFFAILALLTQFYSSGISTTYAASCPSGYTYTTLSVPGVSYTTYLPYNMESGAYWLRDSLASFVYSNNYPITAYYLGYRTEVCYKTTGATYSGTYRNYSWSGTAFTYGGSGPQTLQDRYFTAPNYTPTISSLTVPSYINQSNVSSTPFTINGITDTDAGQTLTYKYSWDNSTWNTAGTGATPKNNASFSFNINTSGRPEGNNILYVKVNDGLVDSNTITSVNILKDTIVPTLTQVTPVTNPTNDATPNYTFSSTEGGIISYSGACDSNVIAGSIGNNTITINALSDGTYTNCSLKVTDAAGNISSNLLIPTFVIDTAPPVAPTSVTINAGAQFTNNPTVNLDIVHPNEPDVNNWCITEGNDYGTCSWGSTKPGTYTIQN